MRVSKRHVAYLCLAFVTLISSQQVHAKNEIESKLRLQFRGKIVTSTVPLVAWEITRAKDWFTTETLSAPHVINVLSDDNQESDYDHRAYVSDEGSTFRCDSVHLNKEELNLTLATRRNDESDVTVKVLVRVPLNATFDDLMLRLADLFVLPEYEEWNVLKNQYLHLVSKSKSVETKRQDAKGIKDKVDIEKQALDTLKEMQQNRTKFYGWKGASGPKEEQLSTIAAAIQDTSRKIGELEEERRREQEAEKQRVRDDLASQFGDEFRKAQQFVADSSHAPAKTLGEAESRTELVTKAESVLDKLRVIYDDLASHGMNLAEGDQVKQLLVALRQIKETNDAILDGFRVQEEQKQKAIEFRRNLEDDVVSACFGIVRNQMMAISTTIPGYWEAGENIEKAILKKLRANSRIVNAAFWKSVDARMAFNTKWMPMKKAGALRVVYGSIKDSYYRR